ncbi:hypothetical protein EH244_17590 [Variovorax beijingensis]|uniref:Uncharacterized protein n=1 Tax=Variovorax beijingensis TaxID=2496117 RepID=A0A3P3EPJ7_9BURK|nr:hypothetical protein [Variovorax beijingensis]RRH87308.1 hypothetical protein EH244_17590 [Variovorax beijingensis]RSZ35598.1 hypothetical protein EJO66_16560 [Variovorax beijingensis]
MRMFGLVGLLLALVIAGVVAKKQMASVAAPALPSVPGAAAPASGEAPADERTQARQVQQQVKEALDAAAQARKMPDDN